MKLSSAVLLFSSLIAGSAVALDGDEGDQGRFKQEYKKNVEDGQAGLTWNYDGSTGSEDTKKDELKTSGDKPKYVFGAQPEKAMKELTTDKVSYEKWAGWQKANLQLKDPDTKEVPEMDDWIVKLRKQAKDCVNKEAEIKTIRYFGPLYRDNPASYFSSLSQPNDCAYKKDEPEGVDVEPTSGGNQQSYNDPSVAIGASDGGGENTSTIRTCKTMIKKKQQGGGGGQQKEAAYDPKWLRLELDNCYNQYILRQNTRYANMVCEEQSKVNGVCPESSRKGASKASATGSLDGISPILIANDQGSNSNEILSAQSMKVQEIKRSDREEAADIYYRAAWRKTLYDAEYSFRKGQAKTEPKYGGGEIEIIKDARVEPPKDQKFGNVEIEDIIQGGQKGGGQTSDVRDPNVAAFLHYVAQTESSGGSKGYERILDPSHPFSPRYDFPYNERQEYSPKTTPYGGDAQKAVRCAGSSGKDIKVDVMAFRRKRFHDYIMSRINTNIYIYQNLRKEVWIPRGCTGEEPCCATKWDGKDKVPTAWCNSLTSMKKSVTAPQLCEWLAKPVVPINMLKMRKNESKNFPNGVPAGYEFKDYFKNHRPYMLLVDTKQEAGVKGGGGNSSQALEDIQDESYKVADNSGFIFTSIGGNGGGGAKYADYAEKDDGSKYAIQGAGREGENCAMGGYGANDKDPESAWTELKARQVAGIRQGLFALPKYSMISKPTGTEDYVLQHIGAAPQIKVEDENGNKNRMRTVPWPYAWRGYIMSKNEDDQFPNFGAKQKPKMEEGIDKALPGDILVFNPKLVMKQGEEAKENEKDLEKGWRLPFLAFVEGGDNKKAREGNQSADGKAGPGSYQVADNGGFIYYAAAGGDKGPESIFVSVRGHGKFPDACGATMNDWGMGNTIAMYKDELPKYIDKRFEKIEGEKTKKCVDSSLAACIEPMWDKVSVYHPQDDNRSEGG